MTDRPRIRLTEVGPRDGLQNEARLLPTEVKVAFVDLLSACGFAEIEVSSFVSAKWIPQLGDAAEVFARIRRLPGAVANHRPMNVTIDFLGIVSLSSYTYPSRESESSCC